MDVTPQNSSPTKKTKRFRSAFTTDQVIFLEREFKQFPYIGNDQRKKVATALNIPERAVKIWFQNRRMKEKKDANNKEFVDEQTSGKATKFDKDQDNVSTMQSTNDQLSNSLPLATTVDNMSKSNIDNSTTNNKRYRVIIKQPVKASYYEKTSCNQSQESSSTSSVVHDSQKKIPRNRKSSADQNLSAEFSIDLRKKHKKECDNGERLDSENVQIKRQNKQNVSVNQRNYDYQDWPEDLSSKKLNLSQHEPKQPTRKPPYVSLVPNYYPQSFIPPGGVFWKPINVMPLISTGVPAVTISTNDSGNLAVVQEPNVNVPKHNCSCDCHGNTYPIPITFQQNAPSPQYVITAMPLQNPCSKY